MASVSSSSSSSSPEPVPRIQKKSKDKGKNKNAAAVNGHGKNEGTDPNWAYKPPAGSTLLDDTTDAGEFDWDTVKNDGDSELWLIRIPDSVKPKFLEDMTIELPISTKSARVGSIQRKHTTFNIWSLGDDDDQGIGGEEVKALSCLLPRKSKNGRLYPAPKPFTRHLIVSAQPVTPTPPPDISSDPHKNPPRQSYPKEVLKHRFMPYGSVGGIGGQASGEDPVEMDVDVPGESTQNLPPSRRRKKEVMSSSNDKKAKKRKGDGEAPSPKKVKKPKTS